jgi:hypothetical protein
MTDDRGHWAQRWILDITRAGIMDVFPNHTFQPAGIVRREDPRTDLAVISRLPALATCAQPSVPPDSIPCDDALS